MRDARGFSLIELLVVISIIALLIGILLPTLASARASAKVTACLSNQRQLGVGVFAYAADFADSMPLSPDRPNYGGFPAVSPDAATNQVFLGSYPDPDVADSATYTGVGLLLDGYLVDPNVQLCTDATRRDLFAQSLESMRALDVNAFTAYTYRNRSSAESGRLSAMGENPAGEPADALLYDFNQVDLDAVGAGPDSLLHGGTRVNALWAGGHGKTLDNSDGRFNWSILAPDSDAVIEATFVVLDEEG
ncbi:MAG: prepilin-type N-terminal cleavage/methylation domain-containing protein [Planctomycetota bacterium]